MGCFREVAYPSVDGQRVPPPTVWDRNQAPCEVYKVRKNAINSMRSSADKRKPNS